MSDLNNLNDEQLPSINQFIENFDDFPPLDDFLCDEFLPSVEEYIVEDVQEDVQEDLNEDVLVENFIEEETNNNQNVDDLVEIIKLINDVRNSISQIPEIKNYDNELEQICESIQLIATSIPEIPEIKYYDNEIEDLKEEINNVRNEIPTFPSWINETPDFSWIGKTFSLIDEDFVKVTDNLNNLKEYLENKVNEIFENIYVKDFENKTDNKQLREDFQNTKEKVYSELKEVAIRIWELRKNNKEDLKVLENKINEEYFDLKQNILEKLDAFSDRVKESNDNISELKKYFELEISSLPEVKYYDQDLNEVRNEIINVSNKISNLEELYSIVENIKLEQNKLNESLLVEPPSSKNSDPLTPLDQKFASLDDLQSHYRTFINRVQQQLATIGGGGETRFEFLDDVDRNSVKNDGYVIAYNASSGKFIGKSVSSGSGGESAWVSSSIGIGTTANVAIGVTSNANYKLYVEGDSFFNGNVSVAGTITYEDVTNIDSVGIITARQDVNVQRHLSVSGITTLGSSNGIGTVYIGLGSTALYVDGDARVTGILTVGRASITIDGDNNTITAGNVLISGSSITIGENVTINAGATGINSAPNVIYVAKDGNDSNNGSSIDNAKASIAAAVSIAQTGTVIKVLSGTYNENNPIEVPAFVSIVGDSLKTVTVVPNNSTQDIFYVNKGTYLAHMTFTGHVAPAAAVAFPPNIAENVGGGDWESPYVQNCTSNTTTGTGMRIDGSLAEGLKSMVVDAYTQYNQGGVGIAITNNGYAQLVSVFTICCNEGITAYKGGQCSLTNSNTDFGTYGLVADGVSDLQFTGIVTTTASAGQTEIAVAITTSTRPYEGQVVYFDSLYYSIETINITNGGSGYTSTPSVSISAPSGPNGITATAFATLNGDKVESITVISSGNQYTSTPSVTISAPDSGVTATAEATLSPIYYTINSSTPIVAGISTLSLDENLINSVSAGSTVYFHQVSKITATSHTFEYVGSGNNIVTATPARGGVPIQENEVIERNGGKVTFTSTDQSGNFRIGNDIVINQNTGTISGRAFSRSLFSEMTPFILALS